MIEVQSSTWANNRLVRFMDSLCSTKVNGSESILSCKSQAEDGRGMASQVEYKGECGRWKQLLYCWRLDKSRMYMDKEHLTDWHPFPALSLLSFWSLYSA